MFPGVNEVTSQVLPLPKDQLYLHLEEAVKNVLIAFTRRVQQLEKEGSITHD